MIRGPKNPNLLLLKLPRTGSTYLSKLLQQHEQISFHIEYLNKYSRHQKNLLNGPAGVRGVRSVFARLLKSMKRRDLRRLLRGSSANIMVGASLNPLKERMSAADLSKVINEDTRIIVLTRSNVLKQYISHLNVEAERAAGARKPHHVYNDAKRSSGRKFHITEKAIDKIINLEYQRNCLFEMIDSLDVPKLFLNYEEHIFVGDKSRLVTQLTQFLDLEESHAWQPETGAKGRTSKYHKIVKDDLREVIQNYDSLPNHPVIGKYL